MSAMHPNEAHPAANSLRVLIVEDSESDAQLLVRELQHFGYAPIWERTDNAAELQAAVTRRTWDVVLCDYRVPQFNGLGALKTVRASAPDLPVILVSEVIGEEMAVAAMRAESSIAAGSQLAVSPSGVGNIVR